MISLKVTIFFCLISILWETESKYILCIFTNLTLIKYYWSCCQKMCLHFKVLTLRQSIMKLFFKVAFIVVIFGNISISFYYLKLVCGTTSGKYQQMDFLISYRFYIYLFGTAPADLIIIMKPMRYIIAFSECCLAYFHFFYVDTPPVSSLSDIFQCRLDKIM